MSNYFDGLFVRWQEPHNCGNCLYFSKVINGFNLIGVCELNEFRSRIDKPSFRNISKVFVYKKGVCEKWRSDIFEKKEEE